MLLSAPPAGSHAPSRICSRLRLRFKCEAFLGGLLSIRLFTLDSFFLCISMQCMFHCSVMIAFALGHALLALSIVPKS